MNDNENPYHSPFETGRAPAARKIDWRLFWLINFGLVVAQATLFLSSFIWSKYQDAQIQQQLGRRFASYDQEFEFYPTTGLFIIAIIVIVPNVIFLRSNSCEKFSAIDKRFLETRIDVSCYGWCFTRY